VQSSPTWGGGQEETQAGIADALWDGLTAAAVSPALPALCAALGLHQPSLMQLSAW
jgi:hypothetical protein